MVYSTCRWLLGACLCVLFGTLPAEAQYFGQNKVQYEDFDFQVLRTANFDIYYYPEESAAAEQAARMAEAWRTRLTTSIGLPLIGRQPLILYASQSHFAQTQVIEGLIGESTGGVTELLKRRMVLPFAGSLAATDHVIGHELVHAFQFDLGGQDALSLPLWFIEGMAEYLTVGSADPHTAMWLRSLAQGEELPSFGDLNQQKYFPYRIGHAAWAFLAARHGEQIVGAAFLEAVSARDAITGIERATGESIDVLSAAWQAQLLERHGLRDRAANVAPGRKIISGDTPRLGRLHVSPSLSPDGQWLVYVSERDLFSLDLFLVETKTGRVVRRLTSTATDPHTESLQFVTSSGGWDAQSRRFAFTTIQTGTPTLTIVDVTQPGRAQEIVLQDVDDAWHATWSPKGDAIAFAGQTGGYSDIYVLDLSSRNVRRLTNDPYSDLHPAWSPTGGQIAFVSDRFTSDLDRLQFGPMRPALVAVADGVISPLPAMEGARHINPQWTVGGRELVLIADPDGVSDVYRLDIESGAYSRVTNVETGVAGLTPLSPALSVAPGTNQYAFGVFTNGGYDLRIADLPASGAAAPDRVEPRPLFGTNEVAPPRMAVAIPSDVVTGEEQPYKPKLALDFIGASGGVGVAGGNVGGFASGGLGLQFSDTLGYHTVSAVVQANGGLRDIGGQVSYVNRTARWNWGGTLQYLPYVTGSFRERLAVVDNREVLIDESLLFRQTDLQARGLIMYPFTRTTRFEVQAGGRRIWFDRELTTRVFGLSNGDLLDEREERLAAPGSLNLADVSAALVNDQVSNGPVGPITGQRYRFDVTQTAGSLSFTSVTLDYRRYLSLVRPFTLAVRGLHVGRYGDDSEDTRLSQLFLGYPSLVRGYDVDSFEASECGPIETGCPVFDRLIGSRLLVGTAELRFPLLGAFSGEYRYGPIPIEAFAFADTGVAWTSDLQPGFSGGDRRFVSSVGAGVRVNAFGYVIVQFAGAKPLNRPGSGWRFVFDFSPAF
jgi:hypothetical protein